MVTAKYLSTATLVVIHPVCWIARMEGLSWRAWSTTPWTWWTSWWQEGATRCRDPPSRELYPMFIIRMISSPWSTISPRSLLSRAGPLSQKNFLPQPLRPTTWTIPTLPSRLRTFARNRTIYQPVWTPTNFKVFSDNSLHSTTDSNTALI